MSRIALRTVSERKSMTNAREGLKLLPYDILSESDYETQWGGRGAVIVYNVAQDTEYLGTDLRWDGEKDENDRVPLVSVNIGNKGRVTVPATCVYIGTPPLGLRVVSGQYLVYYSHSGRRSYSRTLSQSDIRFDTVFVNDHGLPEVSWRNLAGQLFWPSYNTTEEALRRAEAGAPSLIARHVGITPAAEVGGIGLLYYKTTRVGLIRDRGNVERLPSVPEPVYLRALARFNSGLQE